MSHRIAAIARFVALVVFAVFLPRAQAQTCEPPTIVLGQPSVCPGGSTGYAYAATPPSGVGYSAYEWSIVNGTLENDSYSGAIFTASGDGPVELTLVVTDDLGCRSTNSATVPLREIPPPTIVLGQPSVCPGSTGYAYAATPQSGVGYSAYEWSIVNGTLENNAYSGVIYTASGDGPVELTLTVTDDLGCRSTNSASVPLRDIPPPTIVLGQPSVCPGSTGYAYAATPPSGVGYSAHEWSIVNGTLENNSYSGIIFNASGGGPVQLTLTVTDEFGCRSTGSVTIPLGTVTPPHIDLMNPTVCSTEMNRASVGGTFSSYVWSVANASILSGQGTPQIEFAGDGSGPIKVDVTVADEQGCTGSNSVDIPRRGGPVNLIAPSAVCAGALQKASASIAYSYSDFHWTVTHATIEGSANEREVLFRADGSGPVALAVRARNDSYGCPTENSVTIPLGPMPVPEIGASSDTICPLDGASAYATWDAYASYEWTVTNGSVVWQGGPVVQFTADPGAGEVIVTLRVGEAECAATAVKVIPVRATIEPVVELASPTMCQNGTDSVFIDNYDSFSSVSTYIANGVITSTTPGRVSGGRTVTFRSFGLANVTVSVITESNSCAKQTQFDVTVIPVSATISASGPTSLCDGSNVILTASAGTSYLWSNGATTPSITVNASGSYSVAVTNANGCSATSSPMLVTKTPLPDAIVSASGPATLCAGSSVTLTASSAASYLWSTGASTQSITANASGSYSVTVTNANGCSATSSPFTVTTDQTAVAISGGSTTVCPGEMIHLTSSVTDGSAASYQWYGFGGQPLPGETGPTLDVAAQGSATSYYFLRIANASGCTLQSNSFIYTVTPPSATISASGPTAFCSGGSVILAANDGASYLWSNGSTEPWITVTASGDYSVTVTNAAGCSATSAPTTVTVSSVPTAAITAEGPTMICAGGRVTLSAPTGYNYVWSNGATTQSTTVNASGDYTVTVTNASGCSATSSATTVSVNALPTPTISASGPTAFCSGGSVTLTASAGSSYLWSNGATTPSIDVATSGNYSVTVTNANGCSAISSATAVTVNALPSPTISASGPTAFCVGGSVTLTASTGSSYLWSNGATTPSIDVTTSGSYSVTVANASSCGATSAATAVAVNALPAPTIGASGPTTFCVGGSVTLTASAGSSYLWSNGATTSSIDVTTSGSYSVTVTNASSCSATSSATAVTVNALPAPTISASGPTTFCTGGSVTLTASAGSLYLWSTGATTPSIDVTTSGSYSVTVTSASGCSAISSPTAVTVNAKPPASISASGPTTFCAGGSVTLTASAGASYLWSSGATTPSINVTTGGSYSVTVTNASACSVTSAPTTVVVNALPATPTITPSGPTTFCAGASVTLTAPAGYTYLWSTGATTRAIVVSTTGSHGVTVSNASGCSSSSATTNVTVNAATSITLQPQDQTIPKNTSTTLSVTASGSGTLTYQWYKGSSPNTANLLAGATARTYSTGILTKGTYRYWVRVTGSCGLVNSTTAVITAQ